MVKILDFKCEKPLTKCNYVYVLFDLHFFFGGGGGIFTRNMFSIKLQSNIDVTGQILFQVKCHFPLFQTYYHIPIYI